MPQNGAIAVCDDAWSLGTALTMVLYVARLMIGNYAGISCLSDTFVIIDDAYILGIPWLRTLKILDGSGIPIINIIEYLTIIPKSFIVLMQPIWTLILRQFPLSNQDRPLNDI